jgi:hypothetical protein
MTCFLMRYTIYWSFSCCLVLTLKKYYVEIHELQIIFVFFLITLLVLMYWALTLLAPKLNCVIYSFVMPELPKSQSGLSSFSLYCWDKGNHLIGFWAFHIYSLRPIYACCFIIWYLVLCNIQ